MSLETLRQLMVAPASASHRAKNGWIAIEGKLGIQFPRDYREFIDDFGPGIIDEFIDIFSPFAEQPAFSLIERVDSIGWVLRELRSSSAECVPFSIYPEPSPALLPFGVSANGDLLLWITDTDPDSWKIAVRESRAPVFEVFEEPFLEFLVKVLSRSIRVQMFPEDFPSARPVTYREVR